LIGHTSFHHKQNVFIMLITRTLLVVLVVIVALSSFITSQQALTEKQQQELTKYLTDQLKTATTPQQIHYIVASLIKLGHTNAAESHLKDLCDKIAKEAANVKNLTNEQMYHLAAAQLGLKCPVPNEQNYYDEYEKKLEHTLTDLSKSITDLEQAYNAARSLLLYRKKLKTLPNNNSLLNKIYDNVISKFNDSTGGFCSESVTDGDKCLRDTGYAYETLAILHSMLSNKKDLLKSLVNISKQAPTWLKKVATTSATKASAAFVRGLNRLASILPLNSRITRQEIEDSISGFLHKRDKFTVDDAYHIVEGVSSISGSNIHVPILVSDVTRDGNSYKFRVTNAMGQPINGATIKMKAVYPGNNVDESLIGRAQELKGENGAYSWTDADGTIAQSAGIYKFDIDVQVDGLTTSFTRVFKTFASKLDLTDVTIAVGKLNDRKVFSEEQSYKVTQGSTLDKQLNVVVNNDRDRLAVSFVLKGLEPQQTFLRIGDEKRESISVFRKSGGSYRVEVPLEKIAREQLSQPFGLTNPNGTYSLQIIIGDASLQQPLLWTLAKVDFVFQFTLKRDEEGRHYASQPEIKHKFIEPAQRASAGIASTFSLVVAAPAVLFILGLLILGFNFNNCPGGVDALLALVFTGLIGAMLAVIGWFFIEIKIFTALKYLSVLGLSAVLVGSRVLAAISTKASSESH
jgi:hypothetical protein